MLLYGAEEEEVVRSGPVGRPRVGRPCPVSGAGRGEATEGPIDAGARRRFLFACGWDRVLWTLPYKGRIIIGPRVVTDRHVTDLNHHDHQDSGKWHVYNDTPFR